MPNLATPDLIEQWISSFDGKREAAIEHLRKASITPGVLRHRTQVRDWLSEQERLGQIERDTLEHDFMRRQTVAAEQSATAARTSARWAVYSALIACLAILVSIWPYFKLVGALERFLK